ncbi:MAG: hypothetical protein LBD66_00495 [Holosporales bacterium]|jgi:hypothetical protein|nr:hypothetical protein [Holosporales bacterium]
MGARRSGIKGQGVTIAIYEPGPYLRESMNKYFPGRWKSTPGYEMKDPTAFPDLDKDDQNHASNVACCANFVAPEAVFSLCECSPQTHEQGKERLEGLIRNQNIHIVNKSMAPIRDGTGFPDIYSDTSI